MKHRRAASALAIVLGLPFLSCAPNPPPQRVVVNLPRGAAAALPFSDAIRVGHTLYVSGQLGIDFATMKVPTDPKEEARLLLENFKLVVGTAGMSMDDLVTVTVYCSDLSLYAAFNEVYRTYFTGNFPARAFIGSGPLLFGSHFEMQGIAVKP